MEAEEIMVEQRGDHENKAAVGWCSIVLRRGWQVGKKVAVAGAAITAAPVVAPPLLLISTIGLALAFPFTVYLASFAFADKLMSSLLPMPQQPMIMEQDAYDQQGKEVEEEEEENPHSSYESRYPSMAAAIDETRQCTDTREEEETPLSSEGDLQEDGSMEKESIEFVGNQEALQSCNPFADEDGEIEIKENEERADVDVEIEVQEDEKRGSGEEDEEEGSGETETREGEVVGKMGANAATKNGPKEEKQSGGELDEAKKEDRVMDAAAADKSETKIMGEERPKEMGLGKRSEEVGEIGDAGKHDEEMPLSENEIEPSRLSSEYASAVDENSSPDIGDGRSKILTEHGLHVRPAGIAVLLPEKGPARPSKDEDLYSEEKIWEQLYAMRTIVGYRAPLGNTYLEELKALYLFTGVEPPVSSSKDPSNPMEIYNKLQHLKSVIGVR